MSSSKEATRLATIASLSWADCRLLVESVSDYAIFMLDPDGRVATWNLGAERITRYAPTEIIGQHISRFYEGPDIDAGVPGRDLETARQQGRFEVNAWRLRKDGGRFWANVVITPLRDVEAAMRGFAVVTRDLTEQQRAEQKLRESEQRFHHLVDAVTDYAIFMLDETGHVATWNAGAERIKGYTASEIIGQHFSRFYTPEDRVAGKPAKILDAVRSEGRYEDESWRVRKDGTLFWASVILTALRGSHGEFIGIAKVTRDLTSRREAAEVERNLIREQAARSAAEEIAARAAEANRIKDEFLATVSHELRTPLQAIVGWTALLRQRPLDPSLVKAVDVIERNARAQVKIVEDILDVSRIVTGKLRIEPRRVDLRAIVLEAIEVIRPPAVARRLSVEFSAEDEPCILVGDPERLQQVVWNLLSNAVKFTDAGGWIRIELSREASQAVLRVSDSGRGIEPEFLPYVFDRFKQADASTTRRFGGLGLGLALVRHIVELHGGSVRVDSAGPGQGATFSISLPIRAVLPEPAPRERAAPSATAPPAALHQTLGGLRVLVVDDDPDARDLLLAVLSEAGAVVEAVDGVDAAIPSLTQFRPHILVSDIGMPGEDGYSLIRRVHALDPAQGGAIPSIALTAYTRTEDGARALAAGFTTHIGKPVSPNDLVAAVANLATFARR